MSADQIVADLVTLASRLTAGSFYYDHDDDWRLVGVLQDHIDKLRAGWSLVLPDDAVLVIQNYGAFASHPGINGGELYPAGGLPDGTYRLVPVEDDA